MDQTDAVDVAALRERVGALEGLIGRLQHELATPLLTAAGFARIATERAGDADPMLQEVLGRVVDGVARARTVLTTAADLVDVGGLDRVDMAQVLVDAARRRTDGAVEVDVDGPIHCTGSEQALADLADALLDAFASGSAAPTRLAVSVQRQAVASSLLVTIHGSHGPWSAAALAAADDVDVEDDRFDGNADPTAAAVRRAAELCVAQLGKLWLDPEGPDRTATVRLLCERHDGTDGP